MLFACEQGSACEIVVIFGKAGPRYLALGLTRLDRCDLLQQLTRTAAASAESIRVLLLERWSKVVAVTVILLERPATILQDVGHVIALGAENFVEVTLREASCSEHIRDMDSLHPVNPFRLNTGLNSYRDAVYNRPQISQISTD